MAEPTGPTRMGAFVNGKVTRAAALLGAGVVLVRRMVLIAQTIGLQYPASRLRAEAARQFLGAPAKEVPAAKRNSRFEC